MMATGAVTMAMIPCLPRRDQADTPLSSHRPPNTETEGTHPHSGFRSILFLDRRDATRVMECPPDVPAHFDDLNLDQVVAAVTSQREMYDLVPFFRYALADIDSITYRHEVFRDLEDSEVLACIRSFADRMRHMRSELEQAEALRNRHQKERWFLDAVATYCNAARKLQESLANGRIESRGLVGLRTYLSAYISSGDFVALCDETVSLVQALSEVKYCILIKGDRVTVRSYHAEPDYSSEVNDTFGKFRQGDVRDYRAEFSDPEPMNHIETQILDRVAQLHPDLFARLSTYCSENRDYLDRTVETFDREVQFYLAFMEYVAPLERAGLTFTLPCISTDKRIHGHETFDIALAAKLVDERTPVVTNDFELHDKERVLIVTGPNQGGKTTLARTFGQLHHLARIGCPVPGRSARLFLHDVILTHFEKEEHVESEHGKLEDDLFRIRAILHTATPTSIVILNEIFNSTTAGDASFLASEVLSGIMRLDCVCVFVTFLDELTKLGDTIVSMVSTVVPENPAERTYKLERRPADGLAYALSIAEKHRLTQAALQERIPS